MTFLKMYSPVYLNNILNFVAIVGFLQDLEPRMLEKKEKKN